MAKRSTKDVILAQFGAALAWVLLGVLVVGLSGFLLTGLLPVLGLGILVAMLGTVLHTLFIGINRYPAFWVVGGLFTLVLSAVSFVLGSNTGDQYSYQFVLFFLVFYFVSGALLYAVIQRWVIKSLFAEWWSNETRSDAILTDNTEMNSGE